MGDYRVDERDVEFRLCCPAMRRAARVDGRREGPCAPWLSRGGPVTIGACEGSIERDPVRFCPWCGREILPRDRRITHLWDLRRRLSEKEEQAHAIADEDALNLNWGEQAALREEIAALRQDGGAR